MAKYECIFEEIGSVNRYGRLRYIPDSVLISIGNLACRLGNDAIPIGDVIRVVDAGAGAGRFALPFAEASLKYDNDIRLIAIDLSEQMLYKLQEKWTIHVPGAHLRCIKADLQESLPIPNASVHVVYTVATFHIIDRWREALNNLIEILIPGGYLIFVCEHNQFMHETEGFDRDDDFHTIDPLLKSFMKYYHEQRIENAEPYNPSEFELRYSNMQLAIQYLSKCGLHKITPNISATHLRWNKPHSYSDILYCFKHRQMTTWGSDLSERARVNITSALQSWVSSHKIDDVYEFKLPAYLIPYVFQKPRID